MLFTCLKFTSVNVRREPKTRQWKSTFRSVDTGDLITQGVNRKKYGAWKPKTKRHSYHNKQSPESLVLCSALVYVQPFSFLWTTKISNACSVVSYTETHEGLKRVTLICLLCLILVIIHFRK